MHNRKDLTAMGQPVAVDIEVLKYRSVSMANACILCMNIPCHSTIRNVTVSAQAYYTQIWRPYKIKYIECPT